MSRLSVLLVGCTSLSAVTNGVCTAFLVDIDAGALEKGMLLFILIDEEIECSGCLYLMF